MEGVEAVYSDHGEGRRGGRRGGGRWNDGKNRHQQQGGGIATTYSSMVSDDDSCRDEEATNHQQSPFGTTTVIPSDQGRYTTDDSTSLNSDHFNDIVRKIRSGGGGHIGTNGNASASSSSSSFDEEDREQGLQLDLHQTQESSSSGAGADASSSSMSVSSISHSSNITDALILSDPTHNNTGGAARQILSLVPPGTDHESDMERPMSAPSRQSRRPRPPPPVTPSPTTTRQRHAWSSSVVSESSLPRKEVIKQQSQPEQPKPETPLKQQQQQPSPSRSSWRLASESSLKILKIVSPKRSEKQAISNRAERHGKRQSKLEQLQPDGDAEEDDCMLGFDPVIEIDNLDQVKDPRATTFETLDVQEEMPPPTRLPRYLISAMDASVDDSKLTDHDDTLTLEDGRGCGPPSETNLLSHAFRSDNVSISTINTNDNDTLAADSKTDAPSSQGPLLPSYYRSSSASFHDDSVNTSSNNEHSSNNNKNSRSSNDTCINIGASSSHGRSNGASTTLSTAEKATRHGWRWGGGGKSSNVTGSLKDSGNHHNDKNGWPLCMPRGNKGFCTVKRRCYLLIALVLILAGMTVALITQMRGNGSKADQQGFTTGATSAGSNNNNKKDSPPNTVGQSSDAAATTQETGTTPEPPVLDPPSDANGDGGESDAGGASSSSHETSTSGKRTILFNLIANASPDSAILTHEQSGTTPQAFALEWLVANTEFDLHSNERILQRYALAVLYYSTNKHGSSWSNKAQWLIDSDECAWFNQAATVCNDNQELLSLDLSNNNLVGRIPGELHLISSLRIINFNDNVGLVGAIPETLGLLAHLESLDLERTGLKGVIPTELGNAGQLQRISLTGTAIQGSIPNQLGRLTNLQELLLAETALSGPMPAAVCDGMTLPDLVSVSADCDVVFCPCCSYCCYRSENRCTDI